MSANDMLPANQGELNSYSTPEDLLAYAKEEGHELTDEELDQISGGSWFGVDSIELKCPSCGSLNISPQGMHSFKCLGCGHLFTKN